MKAASKIDGCQCLLHTGQVSVPAFGSRDGPRLPVVDGGQGCFAPLLREPLTASEAADLARKLKALADPTRLRLVSMVAAHRYGEACVCELTEPLGLTQPTISHHLKILVEAEIFTRVKRGVWVYFSLAPSTLGALSVLLSPADRPTP
jgi:ArsR family transcriptional regulator, arsenate/arsenite/antimonite-responsive transcriptional repressor